MRWKNIKKFMALLVAGTLLIGSMSGCGDTNADGNENPSPETEEGTPAESEENPGEEADSMYPIEGNVKLTMAVLEEAPVTANAANLMETPFGKAWQEATGVEIELIQLSDGDAMNLLFAGGELPDLVWFNFDTNYPGGANKAVKDKIIEPLNDYMEYAPDLQAVLDSNDLYRKSNMTEDGYIIGFPFIRGDVSLLTSAGLMIRQDWLDDLNMEVPETADEFYEVLKAFKEEKGAQVPFSLGPWWLKIQGVDCGILTSPFGLPKGTFYQEDGVVHYGYAEPEYKDVLAYLNKLYSEGLLDPNFQTLDDNTRNANIMNGDAGVTIASLGGGMGVYLETMADDPDYDLSGVGSLVANKGDTPMSTYYENPVTGYQVVITPACENKEAAVKFLNYGYTEEGSLLFNFGIEGESYTMENGVPTYTDLIQNNPEGLTKQMALAQYTRAWAHGPFVQDKGYQEQYSNLPQQQEALARWTDTNAADYQMPPVSIAESDSSEYSRLMSDIDTYVSEMFVRYITGLESLDTFETEYLPTLESMGVDRVIELQQNALDSFNAR